MFICCVCQFHLICVFFFFKQKTAYEMRISDWSSDVCSSDLACTVFPETRIAEPGEAVETDGPEQVGEREAVAEQPRSGGRPEEIGRASCRERVCQYV